MNTHIRNTHKSGNYPNIFDNEDFNSLGTSEEESQLLTVTDMFQDSAPEVTASVIEAVDEVTELQHQGIISSDEGKRRTKFISCASMETLSSSMRSNSPSSDYDSDEDSSCLPCYEGCRSTLCPNICIFFIKSWRSAVSHYYQRKVVKVIKRKSLADRDDL